MQLTDYHAKHYAHELTVVSALLLLNWLCLLLVFGAFLTACLGAKIHQEIFLIDLEIEAANKLLGELFKIKVQGEVFQVIHGQSTLPIRPGITGYCLNGAGRPSPAGMPNFTAT